VLNKQSINEILYLKMLFYKLPMNEQMEVSDAAVQISFTLSAFQHVWQ